EGDSVVPGDSGLGGRTHSPLPGLEGESVLPGDSGLGSRNHSSLPDESSNDDWPSFVELGYEHGRVDYNNGSFIEWEIGWRIEL
ncbi:hypothetical protein, partial [Streptococcus suis]